ncbi:molybdate ABC transporter substrate-binding protein [Teredinibacter waterburyi]|jgi:molybdenum ABC transporter, periplasmic molybdate-binding protein|uniref:molybdate ABC transporter substrate-binding protein n=1 Tax=Teredinibacter waterburyi TaxID=1500538 RepID=UPI00165FC5DC|nr:molybdate ABC transporter substrate-binding protein [Teredinibacter waterburyi]
MLSSFKRQLCGYRHRLLRLLFAISIAAPLTAVYAAELNIAVAANFLPAMQKLQASYQAETGVILNLSAGSTGKLYTQIIHGAPFALFFAADEQTPARLVEQGFAERTSTYARGQLVLWVAEPQKFGLNSEMSFAAVIAKLAQDPQAKIALANPKIAPYGAAAISSLERESFPASARSRLVMGESVAQAYGFVASGNIAAGFVSASLISLDKQRTSAVWLVPEGHYDPIDQHAVVLSGTINSRFSGVEAAQQIILAQNFLDYLLTKQTQARLKTMGYNSPANTQKETL